MADQKSLSIYFVCDAGMGSSALGAGLLTKRLRKEGCKDRVRNCAIEALPDAVDIIISHHNFKQQIQQAFPHSYYLSIENFMDQEAYERIVKEIMLFKKKKQQNEILDKQNIKLNCTAKDSDDAIVKMGQLLLAAGYIEEGYIQGMLNRDHGLTTYIGNDIAIPHGEYEVKDCVKKTGIAVMIYPDGILWAQGRARIVIGIAAKNDDHMTILANIASKLGEMETVEEVVAGDVDTIYDILSKEEQV